MCPLCVLAARRPPPTSRSPQPTAPSPLRLTCQHVPVPSQPMLFDLAHNFLEFPDLDAKVGVRSRALVCTSGSGHTPLNAPALLRVSLRGAAATFGPLFKACSPFSSLFTSVLFNRPALLPRGRAEAGYSAGCADPKPQCDDVTEEGPAQGAPAAWMHFPAWACGHGRPRGH